MSSTAEGGEEFSQPQELATPAPLSSLLEGVDPALSQRLHEREDQIKDWLTIVASNLGTYPELVAEVMAQSNLGSPVDEATRAHIRSNYTARMLWLQQQFGQQP